MSKRRALRTPREPVVEEAEPIVEVSPEVLVVETPPEPIAAVEESPEPIEAPRGRRITADTANDLPLMPFYSRKAVRAAPLNGPLFIGNDYYDETFVGFVVYEADCIVAVPHDEFLANYITASV